MFIEENYIINPEFMCMVGIYDRNARPCTLVRERNRTFIADQSPLEILDHSIRCIGYDLKGAMATARWLLGNKNMCPVMVNPIHRICVFPDKSANHADAMWFNPYHIARTNSLNRQARIEFSNGLMMTIPSKLYSFNHKLQTAEQFMKMTVELGSKSPLPKKGPKKGA